MTATPTIRWLVGIVSIKNKSLKKADSFARITSNLIYISSTLCYDNHISKTHKQRTLSVHALLIGTLRLLLYTHTCPVTEFAVASHLNTANSCCHHVFLRHFRFQKCLSVYSSLRFFSANHLTKSSIERFREYIDCKWRKL